MTTLFAAICIIVTTCLLILAMYVRVKIRENLNKKSQSPKEGCVK